MPPVDEMLKESTQTESLYRKCKAEISYIKHLSIEEEQKLAIAKNNGDEKAKEQLIKCNLHLVIKIAETILRNSYHNPDYENLLLDSIQEGNCGLYHAVENYQPKPNARFSTYSFPYIKGAILKKLKLITRHNEIQSYVHPIPEYHPDNEEETLDKINNIFEALLEQTIQFLNEKYSGRGYNNKPISRYWMDLLFHDFSYAHYPFLEKQWIKNCLRNWNVSIFENILVDVFYNDKNFNIRQTRLLVEYKKRQEKRNNASLKLFLKNLLLLDIDQNTLQPIVLEIRTSNVKKNNKRLVFNHLTKLIFIKEKTLSEKFTFD